MNFFNPLKFVHIILVFILVSSTGLVFLTRSQAASVSDLEKQKEALERQARDAENQAKRQKSVAERAADKISEVNGQIGSLQQQITGTNQNISETKGQITQKNQEVDSLEAELRKVKDQQDVIIRQIYMVRVSLPNNLVLFSNENISKRERDQAQFKALKKSLESMFAKTNSAKLAVEKNRDELIKKNTDLENYKSQQQEQKIGLADIQTTQAQLKDDAEGAVVALEAKAKAARAQEEKIKNQISAALTAAIKASRSGTLSGAGIGGYVSRGEVVGHLGSTGNSTGPHVHFEVRVNNVAVNPAPYVSNGTLSWPVSNYTISQGYGECGNTSFYNCHTGIDLAGPYGQPVRAPATGRIILRQFYGGYGNAVAIQLDSGLVVLLGHMIGN